MSRRKGIIAKTRKERKGEKGDTERERQKPSHVSFRAALVPVIPSVTTLVIPSVVEESAFSLLLTAVIEREGKAPVEPG